MENYFLMEKDKVFAVVYKFKLKPAQEDSYKKSWHMVAEYFVANCGAIGSSLHKGDDGLWLAYSRWPNKDVRDAVWLNNGLDQLPQDILEAVGKIKEIKQENEDSGSYEEICLDRIDELKS